MLPGKQLWEWHSKQEALASACAQRSEIEEEKGRLADRVAICEQRIHQLGKPISPDDEIARLLAEQELWLARNELEQFLQKYEERLAALIQRIQEHEFDLILLEQKLPKEWIDEYDRVAKMKRAPIVEVKKDACTGCFMELSLQNQKEWRKGKGLVHCEECGRILV